MDMDLENLIVVADHQAVADAVEIDPQGIEVHVRVLLADNVDRVIGEGDVLQRGALGKDRGRLGDLLDAHLIRRREDLALQGGKHGLEDHHVAHAARVHNAGLLEHGIKVDGVGQGLFPGGDGGLQRVLQRGALLRGGAGGLGGQAGDGEDRALGGLHDGLVGGVHALLHSGGEGARVRLVQALELFGNAAKQQAQNHAGVAARRAQQGGGHAVSRGGDGGKLILPQLHGGLFHGQAHVGAGVAVRNGKNVQIIDGLDIGLQRGIGAQDAFFEGRGVYHISQVTVPLFALSDDRVDIHIDTADGYARGFGKLIADLVDDAPGHGAHVHAVIHADVQLQRDGAVLIKMHGNALGHGLPAQKLQGAAFLAASDHTLDAEAARSRHAGQIGQDLACDADRSLFVGDVYHATGAPFQTFRLRAYGSANQFVIIL